MPRKPAVRNVPARRLGQAAVIWINGQEQLVRSVSVILHLANGVDQVVEADADVQVLVQQPMAVVEKLGPVVGE